ncbi:MAG: hypothetical protein JRN20_20865 [Nitrososphaerota archaeon]|nr:hypothetical protein [Nitrososphaerota archaeon]
MSDKLLSMLSNLGALSSERAVTVELLSNSERLKGIDIDSEISRLEQRGYVKRADDKIYLTESGLIRALSMIS